MARLQDFQTVTPTSSDNLLIVQSQGQGLASVGSTLGAKMDKANPTGTGAFSLNRKSGTTTGTNSVAEGYTPTASGHSSHAEGYATTASATGSHSEGVGTTASADYSHAEGNGTIASGAGSHAEGYGCEASGARSHAEGNFTIANHLGQHAFGAYNVADASTATADARGNYIEIVGKGTSGAARSNARTLDWSGNEVLAGDLTIMGSKSLNTALVGEDISSHFHAETGHTITSAKKFGNLIVLTITTSKVTSANSSIQVGTIDSGYRPTAPASGTLLNATASDFGYGTIGITTAGVINLIYSRTTSYGLYTTLVYSI